MMKKIVVFAEIVFSRPHVSTSQSVFFPHLLMHSCCDMTDIHAWVVCWIREGTSMKCLSVSEIKGEMKVLLPIWKSGFSGFWSWPVCLQGAVVSSGIWLKWNWLVTFTVVCYMAMYLFMQPLHTHTQIQMQNTLFKFVLSQLLLVSTNMNKN